MQSKLAAWAARVSEAGWLAALLIVPLLFNLYSERLFEEDKIPLMRAIALVCAAALLVWRLERGREEGAPPTERRRHPAIIAALALLGSYTLSTLFSIAPQTSLWGGYIRRQGLFTWVAYLLFFAAILLLVRRRPQVERIVSTMLLASIPAALYAIAQNRGLDPLPWGTDVTRRVASTAGNPIFIGAYMMMVMSLTLARLIERGRQLLARAERPRRTGLLAALYLLLLLLQGLTLIFSQSRGPLIGLGAGLTLFGTLLALRRSRALTLGIAALAGGALLFLVLFNQPNSPLAPLRQAPYIGRLGRLFEVERGTGRVRTLIWQGDAALLADAPPLRLLIGSGPETLGLAYNPYYPPELAQVEKRNSSPDRSHNETFDVLVTLGLVGLVAQMALFLSLFLLAFEWLGMIRSRRQRWLFIAGAVAMGAVGWLLPMALDGGSIRYSGVGMPAAIALWLLLYAIGFALTHLRESAPPLTREVLLVMALLSVIVAHFIEIHFGIAIAMTRLYFWVAAALLIVLVNGWLRDEAPAAAAARLRPRRGGAALVTAARATPSHALGAVVGLMLVVLTFNFVTELIPLSPVLLVVAAATWLLGALLVIGEAEAPWTEALYDYAIPALGIPLLFALLYVPWSHSSAPSGTVTLDAVLAYGYHLANSIGLVYLAALLWMVGWGWWMARGQPTAAPRRAPWQLPLYALLVVALPVAILRLNLDLSRADSFSKQGNGYEKTGQWALAERFYDEALRLNPREDRYSLNLGRALLEQGRQTTGPQQEAYLAEAEQVLSSARRANPLNTDHTRNLASLHRVWASLTSDPAEAQRHREAAEQFYREAVALSPHNARLLNEWATLRGEVGDTAGAYDLLNRSLALDSRYEDTYLLLANQAILDEDYPAALDYYDQALEVAPDSRKARGGRAYVYSLMGEPQEAIRLYEAILVDLPDDYVSLKNLALLYRDAGERATALDYARRALPLAPAGERAAIEGLVQQLEAAP